MNIILIRHAESTSDIEDRYGGDYDDSLTLKGKTQAKNLGKELKTKKIQVIFHSPLKRAKQTAKIANQEIKVKLIEINSLKERNNYGVLTGLTKEEGKIKFPEEAKKVKGNKMFHNIRGSETYTKFKTRINKTLKEIITTQKHEPETIGIVTHGGVLFVIVREILKLGEIKYQDCAYLELKYDKKLELTNIVRAKIKKIKKS